MANLTNINGYFNVTDAGLVNVVNGGLYITKTSGDAITGIISSGGSGRPYYLRSNTNGNFAIYDDTACLERLTILSGGNIGIGTNVPDVKLHVYSGDSGATTVGGASDELILENDTDCGLTIRSGTSSDGVISFADSGDHNIGQVYYSHSSNSMTFRTNDSTAVTINSSQNVGIGLTSPTEKLDVEGNIQAINTAGSSVAYVDIVSGATWRLASNPTSGTNAYGLNIIKGSAGTDIKMSIDTNGNVGIGTTAPARKLHVSSADNQLARFESTDAYSGIEICDNSSGTAKPLISALANDFIFYGGGSSHTQAMSIGGSGKVIVGADSSNALEVFSSGDTEIGFSYATRGNIYSKIIGDITVASPLAGELAWQTATGGTLTERMRLKANGYLGIGTDSPGSHLSVAASNGGKGIELQLTTSTGPQYILAYDRAGSVYVDMALSAMNTIFQTNNGTERMRIASSGNVGIGTTSPTHGKLAIHSTASSTSVGGNLCQYFENFDTTDGQRMSIGFRNNNSVGTTGYIEAVAYDQSIGATDLRFSLYDGSSWHNDMVIFQHTGQVGIGTIPSAQLDVLGTINIASDGSTDHTNSRIILNSTQSNARGAGVFMHNTNDDEEWYDGVPYNAGFDKWMVAYNSTASHSDGTAQEANAKFIIEKTGDIIIGGTAVQGARTVSFDVNTNGIVHDNNTTDGAGNGWEFQTFRRDTNQIGSIVMNGTTGVTYSETSDYRLKENVTEITDALDRVSKLKPSRFNFISEKDRTVDGFLAHEVQDVVPEAVVGTKDAVEEYEVTPMVLDEEKNVIKEAVIGTRPKYQNIDKSKLVPLLVAAIQELKADNDTLKARIETLENK